MTSRVEKLMKKEFPIFVRDRETEMRKNFIEQGRSEVMCCLGYFGSGGISTFQVKCVKDLFNNSEELKFYNKIDNSCNSRKISSVGVKLIRVIRLMNGSTTQTT